MCQPASGKSALSTFKSPHPNEITIWLNDSSTIDKVESFIVFKYSFKVLQHPHAELDFFIKFNMSVRDLFQS